MLEWDWESIVQLPESLHSFSDEQLLVRYRQQAGSAQSRQLLDELFGRHYTRVSVWCLRFTGNRETAFDLAQEIFASAYRYIDTFQGQSKFSTWLYSITRNRCLTEAQKRTVETESLDLPESVEPSVAANVLERLVSEESVAMARELIERSLDETERQVFVLHYAEDMPLDAITRLLRLENKSGAKAFIVSAKRKLATALDRLRARERWADEGGRR